MKQIPLTQGKFALVDDEDYEYLMQWKWCAAKDGHTYYAQRITPRPNRRSIRMHRELIDVHKGQLVDHKDRNGLNCQKNNLRIANHSENQRNKMSKPNSSSKYLGVSLVKNRNKWKSDIMSFGKYIYIGWFNSEKEAALAYNKKANEIHGEFANLNVINND